MRKVGTCELLINLRYTRTSIAAVSHLNTAVEIIPFCQVDLIDVFLEGVAVDSDDDDGAHQLLFESVSSSRARWSPGKITTCGKRGDYRNDEA